MRSFTYNSFNSVCKREEYSDFGEFSRKGAKAPSLEKIVRNRLQPRQGETRITSGRGCRSPLKPLFTE